VGVDTARYVYSATLVRVVDGDTVDVDLTLGFDITYRHRLRLLGVNAPEMSTAAGRIARDFVVAWFAAHGSGIVVHTEKDRTEKFGRYLATIYTGDGASLTSDLLSSGNAVPYPG